MVAVYSTNSVKYNITQCTKSDVDIHYETIRSNVTDTDESVYKKAMLESVNEGTAYKASIDGKDVAWLYVHKVINTWLGSSIYKSDFIGMLLVFKEFSEHAINCRTIRYTPHKGMLTLMKSIVTGQSLRLYHNGIPYVKINVTELINKFTLLYNKLGITNVSSS